MFWVKYRNSAKNPTNSNQFFFYAGNVKQVLTIVLSVVIFNLRITPLNGVGILLTLAGGAWYT